MIIWSTVAIKTTRTGVDAKEITMCGCLVGYMIGGREVRPDVRGWFDEAQVDEAIEAATMGKAA